MGTKPTLESVAQGILETHTGATIELTSPQWVEWLSSAQSFRYCPMSPDAPYTARKEKGDFWYGYRKVSGKLHKRYIGKSEDLKTDRLEEIGRLLNVAPEAKVSGKAEVTHQESVTNNEEIEGLQNQIAELQKQLQIALGKANA